MDGFEILEKGIDIPTSSFISIFLKYPMMLKTFGHLWGSGR
jgi:hypothetical protein